MNILLRTLTFLLLSSISLLNLPCKAEKEADRPTDTDRGSRNSTDKSPHRQPFILPNRPPLNFKPTSDEEKERAEKARLTRTLNSVMGSYLRDLPDSRKTLPDFIGTLTDKEKTILKIVQKGEKSTEFVCFSGDPGNGKSTIMGYLAEQAGYELIVVNIQDYLNDPRKNITKTIDDLRAQNKKYWIVFEETDGIGTEEDQRSRGTDPHIRALQQQFWLLLDTQQRYNNDKSPTKKVAPVVFAFTTNTFDKLPRQIRNRIPQSRHEKIENPTYAKRIELLGGFAQEFNIADDLNAKHIEDMARITDSFSNRGLKMLVQTIVEMIAEKRGTDASYTLRREDYLPLLAQSKRDLNQSHNDSQPEQRYRKTYTTDDIILPSIVQDLPPIVKLVIKDLQSTSVYDDNETHIMRLLGLYGTDRATLAKIIAKQAGCTLHHISSHLIADSWVNSGPQHVHKIFQSAEQSIIDSGKPVMLFFDHCDSLLKEDTEAMQVKNGTHKETFDTIINFTKRHKNNPGIFVIFAAEDKKTLNKDGFKGIIPESRVIEMPAPDAATRRKLIETYFAQYNFDPIRDMNINDKQLKQLLNRLVDYSDELSVEAMANYTRSLHDAWRLDKTEGKTTSPDRLCMTAYNFNKNIHITQQIKKMFGQVAPENPGKAHQNFMFYTAIATMLYSGYTYCNWYFKLGLPTFPSRPWGT